ncbi:MAG: hypothetical protein KC776_43565 [Myxococcales bacterium]|nr:hypothetical protein [Myxococcales bacterium]MCB9583446.1 hypothetical protein [Polyangiaceae bacterium]
MARSRIALALGALALLAPVLGVSQPKARFPADQPVPLSARVALLEGRVHDLEQQVQGLSQGRLSARPDGSYQIDANGARVMIGADGTVTTSPSPATSPMACDPPYTVDKAGIRHPKPSCR